MRLLSTPRCCWRGLKTSSGRMDYPVHILYSPPEGVEHTTTIVLFHGLSRGPKEWEDTWLTRGGPLGSQVCWPREWLPKLFQGKVLVLALSYDASPRGVNEHVSEIGHNLRVSLICSKTWKLADPNKPQSIVLIGHSFGGLVIKSLVCKAQEIANQTCRNELERRAAADCQAFLKNLKGVVFYSVPHTGTEEYFIKYWTQFSRKSQHVAVKRGRLAGIMKNLHKFSREMQQLTEDFESYVPADISIFAFIEGKCMPGSEKLLVPAASAMLTARHNLYKVEEADHFEVCRPLSENDVSHKKLVDFLEASVGPLQTECSTSTNATELEESLT